MRETCPPLVQLQRLLQQTLFTIYLQNLHFYLQSKITQSENIKLDSQNQFERYEAYEKPHLFADLTAGCGERTSIC
jgi:hypothetical protein